MITKFIIEVETKEVNQIYADDSDFTKENEIPKEETEKEIHRAIRSVFENILNPKNRDTSKSWEEIELLFSETIDTPVEDWEAISDYGKITIKVKEDKK